MIASATKFEINGILSYITFLRLSQSVVAQAKNAKGLIAMKINPISLRTLTIWEDEASMKLFRNTEAHLAAMKASAGLGVPWSISWETDVVPSWQDGVSKINVEIKSSKLS